MDFAAIRQWARDYVKWYFTRRGVVSLAILAASAAGLVVPALAGNMLLPAAVAGIGGIILTTLDRLSSQRAYEQEMLDLYRHEVADEIGRAPQTLTRDDLREAAKSNEVIAQALKRQEHRTALAIGTESLAAVATVGLVWFFSAVEILKHAVQAVAETSHIPWASLGVYLVGAGTVASIMSTFAHQAVERVIGQVTGVAKAAAHDRILELQQGLNRGQAATPEAVYGVLVAGDPDLARSIAKQFRRAYAQMDMAQQRQVLETVGVAECIGELTAQINNGTLDTGRLAYMIGEEGHMRRTQVEESLAATHPECKSFVERLGLAHRHSHHSHREQVEARRAAAPAVQTV